MNSWVWAAGGVLLVVLVVFLISEVMYPLLALRRALARLAAGDFKPVLSRTRSGLFWKSALRMRTVSEMLQRLDRQISDEGFSLRAILSSMVEGVLIVDPSQRIRLANDALGRMFRFSASPINRTAIEVFRSPDLQSAIAHTLEHSGSRRIELTLDTPSEQRGYRKRHFEVYASALAPQKPGSALGAVVVFHDITAVKELEAVRREFVSNVSHEFRTPLSIINGYIETLLDGALEDREMAARSLRVMAKNGERLSLLIEDLLTITRLEHRTEQLDLRRMNLRETLAKTLERLDPAIGGSGATVEVDWEEGAEIIEGDSRRIEQIFANLLENALSHGLAQNPLIRIEARLSGDTVRLVFSDNGPGIPPDDRIHIFERFYRVAKDRSRAAGGTGLGLSIVKHIAQAHGGSVFLDPASESGATFVVVLPVSHGAVGSEGIEPPI
jgi:two-component system, OmpR family, phosphate regulon sensor histidine kinase PhoR